MTGSEQQPHRKDFTGRVALVTGAGSGIGRAAAELFAARGAAVAVVNRTAAKGLEVVEAIRAAGGIAEFIQADLAEPESVPMMVRKTVELFGGLHCAFNNAGITGSADEFHRHALAEWNQVIAVNLTAVFLCMQHEIEHMLGAGGGAIVNNGSGASIMGAAGLPHYTAAKHGLLGLAKVAAKEYCSRNIRINTICPGVIDTGPMRAYMEGSPDQGSGFLAALPGGSMGQPAAVASAAVWLCSAEAAYVSGANLVVDGGFMSL
jgi:NAD(P)-dependent dehydrogenase (short-subunit alcohol dehydrogenase family)